MRRVVSIYCISMHHTALQSSSSSSSSAPPPMISLQEQRPPLEEAGVAGGGGLFRQATVGVALMVSTVPSTWLEDWLCRKHGEHDVMRSGWRDADGQTDNTGCLMDF